MSAMDLVAVLLGVVALTACVVLTLTVVSLRRQTARLEALVGELVERVGPTAARLEAAADRAGAQAARVEDLIDAATAFSATTEAAGRVLATPVIKSAALAAGTQQMARRLRGTGRPQQGGRQRRQEGA